MSHEPLGHTQTVEGLWRAAARGRLAHALMFVGPEGVGKFVAMRWFAAGLMCQGGPGAPCGECGPCKRMSSGGESSNHPDLLVLDPVRAEVERIPIDWITERDPGHPEPAEKFLSLRALEAAHRVVLLREVHRMTVQAQNALLKTLEEPVPGTVLVLETSRPEVLLDTVRSRCVRVHFGALEPAEAVRVLSEQGLGSSEASELARWARGAPGVALHLHNRGSLEMRAHLESLLCGEGDALELSSGVWDLPGEFPGKTPRVSARERARCLLDLLLSVLGDRARLAAGIGAESLAHGDLAERVAWSAAEGPRLIARLLDARSDIEANLAPEAVLDRAMLAAATTRSWKTTCASSR